MASLAAVAGAFSVQAAEVGDTFETSASVISSCSMTLTHPVGTLKYDPVGINASQDSTTNHLPFSEGRPNVWSVARGLQSPSGDHGVRGGKD